jgi:hypothetical protein
MTTIYKVNMEHTYIVKTNDINEVLLNYEFPDFTACESLDENNFPEYISSVVGYEEITEEELENM